MGGRRTGRVKIEPGPWSLAAAAVMRDRIDARPGRRRKFQSDAEMSSRLSQLLNGNRSWYLEDIVRACSVLDISPVEFLLEVELRTAEFTASPTVDDAVSPAVTPQRSEVAWHSPASPDGDGGDS